MVQKLLSSLASAVAIAVVSAGGAHADGHHLKYNPQELQTLSGAEKVYNRINSVARAACKEQFDRHRLVRYSAQRERCVTTTVRELVSEVNHPNVYQVHANRGAAI